MGCSQSSPIISINRLAELMQKAKDECKTAQDLIDYDNLCLIEPYSTNLYKKYIPKYDQYTDKLLSRTVVIYSSQTMFGLDDINRYHNEHYIGSPLSKIIKLDYPESSKIQLYEKDWNELARLCHDDELLVTRNRSC